MKKVFLLINAFLLCSFVFAKDIRVGVLNGPSCIPTAYLMENKSDVIDFSLHADVQALLPKMIKKEVDIGFMPVNVAAKVFNSSNKAIVCCAITGNGNISLLTNSVTSHSINDLKGKLIYVAGQGATPDYMFRYILAKNKISIEKDVQLEYSIPTAQLPANLISKKVMYIVVPEPFTTITMQKDPSIKKLVDFQLEYEDFNGAGSTYPLTVMVATKDFVTNHPDLMKEFLDLYKQSYEWTIKNPKTAGQLAEKNELGLAKNIVTAAIPKSNYTFITKDEMQDSIEDLLEIFIEFAPESIGGKLPDGDFYYGKKNP